MLNSDRFLKTFNMIEHHLRKVTKKEKDTTFSTLIDLASRSDAAVRALKEDLKEFAELRNAIVHDVRKWKDGRPIAEPNDWAVAEIERIASLLTDPPKVIPLFQKKVFTLEVNDPIAKAVKSMFDHSFSQIPIYDGQEFMGLLTTNTVVRWLGACVAEDILSLTETSVASVLSYTEDPDNYCFFGRKATLFEALEKFQDYARDGKKLEAILITESGKGSVPCFL